MSKWLESNLTSSGKFLTVLLGSEYCGRAWDCEKRAIIVRPEAFQLKQIDQICSDFLTGDNIEKEINSVIRVIRFLSCAVENEKLCEWFGCFFHSQRI